ncbi:MAG: multicopper oxidase domain-containing protein, partial [Deltaproteobacteria bacterium]|nr:multicopper oxidase domain-containing protein [Deltaproteobacteria bacterium]
LSTPVSMVFPGQASPGAIEIAPPSQAGLLALEALPGGTVSYSFTVSEAGTYYYQSGTDMDKQIQMGLFGAIVVRPTGFNPLNPRAYGHADSAYDREELFLISEMDAAAHEMVEFGAPIDTTSFYPVYWFFNGRNAPDTMAPAGVPWLPAQPYNCMPMILPGEKLLMRVIGIGRDLHPFHHHGNHARIIGEDGRLLESTPGSGPDLSYEVFTIQSAPGKTYDALFTWTGEGLNWDIYGPIDDVCVDADNDGYDDDSGEFCHDSECTDGNADDFDDATHEYCPDHGKPFPLQLPSALELTFGGFWSGSPFMGDVEPLPPGEGGLNPMGGFTYMWHSHTEKEMVNNDIFPGGMMTMLIVMPPWADIVD